MNITSSMKIFLVALSIFCFCALGSCSENRDDPGPENKSAHSEGTPEPGEGAVVLGETAQEKGGIVTAPLGTILHQREIKAYGTVTDLRDYFEAGNRFAEALAQVQKAGADLTASKKAYDRLKTLYQDRRDVSAKALQEAEAKWRSGEADARAARSSLDTVKVQARQQWGNRLAEWLITDSREFERLRGRDEMLIQVTVPPDVTAIPPPSAVQIQTATGKFVQAAFVSTSPQSDPRIQGQSFFYMAPAKEVGLLPGMNVLAFLPAGPRSPGVVIPSPAIVWRDGKAWAYLQQAPGRFVRREVPDETPVKEGWFVTTGFQPGDLLVVTGAQLLLSKEFLPARQKEEDED